MHKDEREELDRLQRALLAEEPIEEEPEEELDEEPEEEDDGAVGNVSVYRNYSNGYGRNLRNYASGYRAYDIEQEDDEDGGEDWDDHNRTVSAPKVQESNRGLWLLALALLAGILLLVLIWVGRFHGVIAW